MSVYLFQQYEPMWLLCLLNQLWPNMKREMLIYEYEPADQYEVIQPDKYEQIQPYEYE